MEERNRFDNSFEILRLVAASAVLFSHSYALYGLPEPQPVSGRAVGGLAVGVFFAISGFLVAQSWDRDPDLKRFTYRRALRILPGLFVAVSFTTLVIGPLMTMVPLAAYFRSAETWGYLFSNASLVMGQDTLPGVFEENVYPREVNGSLWTLRYEFLVYAFLASLGLCAKRSTLPWMCLITFLVFVVGWCICQKLGFTTLQLPLPVVWRIGFEIDWMQLSFLGAFFFGGSLLYFFASSVRLSGWVATLLCAACAMATSPFVVTLLLWISIPYAVVTLAYRAPVLFRRLGKQSDVSYGIYIYAFPVQQSVASFAVPAGAGWIASLTVTSIVTFLLAALSWRYIERPALALKRHLFPRRADTTAKSSVDTPS